MNFIRSPTEDPDLLVFIPSLIRSRLSAGLLLFQLNWNNRQYFGELLFPVGSSLPRHVEASRSA